MTILTMNLGASSYPIIVGKGLLSKADEFFNLNRKAFIITDDGVPNKYAEAIKSLCKAATVYTVKSGEGSKSLSTLEQVLVAMAEADLTRGDCIVAVGGGVVGDLSGFAASVYMRGIDFYNVPTTLLAQVDSSIGGKTAVNLGGIKNIVGAFKQPKAVIVDTDTLATLDPRHFNAGLCEAIKMAATSNEALFEAFESMSKDEVYNNIEDIIVEALKIKKSVVEEDECETGVRKILNFGHTFGHCVESTEGLSGLYHGECVAIGMLAITDGEVNARLKSVLDKFDLPTSYEGNAEDALAYASHDKKRTQKGINIVLCNKIGTYDIKNVSIEKFNKIVLKQ